MCKQRPGTIRHRLCCKKLGTSHNVKGFAIGSFLERTVVERAKWWKTFKMLEKRLKRWSDQRKTDRFLAKFALKITTKLAVFYQLLFGEVCPENSCKIPAKWADFSVNLSLKIPRNLTFSSTTYQKLCLVNHSFSIDYCIFDFILLFIHFFWGPCLDYREILSATLSKKSFIIIIIIIIIIINLTNKVDFCTFLCISLVFSHIQKWDCPDFRSPDVGISVFSTYFVPKYFNLTESPVNWFCIRVVYVFISVNLEMKRDALPRKQCTTVITQKKLAL